MSDDLCRGCSAQIRWVKTEAGRAMPVDLAVTTTENPEVVLYSDQGKRVIGISGVVRSGHVPHWASCPVRERFKRQSGKRGQVMP